MLNVTVRQARDADRAQLIAIFAACRQRDFSWLPPEAMTVEDFSGALEGETVFVAERSGELLGLLTLWEPGRFIHFLFVAPPFQGQGVANQLVARMVADYAPPYRLKCLDKNLRALKYYRREGWREVGRGDDLDGAHRVLELDRRPRSEQGRD